MTLPTPQYLLPLLRAADLLIYLSAVHLAVYKSEAYKADELNVNHSGNFVFAALRLFHSPALVSSDCSKYSPQIQVAAVVLWHQNS